MHVQIFIMLNDTEDTFAHYWAKPRNDDQHNNLYNYILSLVSNI